MPPDGMSHSKCLEWLYRVMKGDESKCVKGEKEKKE